MLPVDVQTFVESPDFLDCRGTLYPAVMDQLRELNSGEYVEAVLTGAIGTGKSTIALFTTAMHFGGGHENGPRRCGAGHGSPG